MEIARPLAGFVDRNLAMVPARTHAVRHFMQTFVEQHLDRLPRPELRWFNHPLPAFQVCGYTGLLLGFVQSMILTERVGLSQLVLLGITGVVVVTFHSVVMATKIFTGEEQIIYYHHEIAVVAMLAVFLRLIHQPVLRYLDVVILGIGLFLACGRVGCLMVGCCHGRPAGRGIRYNLKHAKAGFPDHLVGVRLFPVQAVESLFVLVMVLMGIVLLLHDSLPGEVLEWYTVVYGLGRFGLEFLRGDLDRPYYWGFSQAQWISSILMASLLWAEFQGALPFHPWHAVACAALFSTVLLVAISRRVRKVPEHLLLRPQHVGEIAEAIEFAISSGETRTSINCHQGQQIPVGCTSLGILVSGSKIELRSGHFCQYTISSKDGTMTADVAQAIASLICRLRHPACNLNLVRGNGGTFHLVVPT